MSEESSQTPVAKTVRATGKTFLERLINVPIKTITGCEENEYFDANDMRLAMGYGAVGGAVVQGLRANRRIAEAAVTGQVKTFRYGIL